MTDIYRENENFLFSKNPSEKCQTGMLKNWKVHPPPSPLVSVKNSSIVDFLGLLSIWPIFEFYIVDI